MVVFSVDISVQKRTIGLLNIFRHKGLILQPWINTLKKKTYFQEPEFSRENPLFLLNSPSTLTLFHLSSNTHTHTHTHARTHTHQCQQVAKSSLSLTVETPTRVAQEQQELSSTATVQHLNKQLFVTILQQWPDGQVVKSPFRSVKPMESLMSSLVLGADAGAGGGGDISCSRLWWGLMREDTWDTRPPINKSNIRLWGTTCTMTILTWVRRSISPSISLNMASMSSICWKRTTKVNASYFKTFHSTLIFTLKIWRKVRQGSSQDVCKKLLSCLTNEQWIHLPLPSQLPSLNPQAPLFCPWKWGTSPNSQFLVPDDNLCLI